MQENVAVNNTPEQSKAGYVYLLNNQLALEAIDDKILVLVDKFKSGYECSACEGEGYIKLCQCVEAERPGKNRLGGTCSVCDGDPDSVANKQCSKCDGRGTSLVIPDSAKVIPTSGVIVSVGPDCKSRKLNERVLFGAHTGYYLPFKGNIKIRCLREFEVLCLIHKLNPDADLKDFVQVEG